MSDSNVFAQVDRTTYEDRMMHMWGLLENALSSAAAIASDIEAFAGANARPTSLDSELVSILCGMADDASDGDQAF